MMSYFTFYDCMALGISGRLLKVWNSYLLKITPSLSLSTTIFPWLGSFSLLIVISFGVSGGTLGGYPHLILNYIIARCTYLALQRQVRWLAFCNVKITTNPNYKTQKSTLIENLRWCKCLQVFLTVRAAPFAAGKRLPVTSPSFAAVFKLGHNRL